MRGGLTAIFCFALLVDELLVFCIDWFDLSACILISDFFKVFIELVCIVLFSTVLNLSSVPIVDSLLLFKSYAELSRPFLST